MLFTGRFTECHYEGARRVDIKNLKKNWDEFGTSNPLWAILTDPIKKGNRWNPDEFFRTGQDEIDQVMRYVEVLGIDLKRGKALDFGCGAGRLTQALIAHFDQAYGVDIAPSMIQLANQYNRFGERCKYIVNKAPDLSIFEDDSFDFIYSNIVLQHMKQKYSKKYIVEFLRILSPHGLLIFQQPSREKPREAVKGIRMYMREITRSLFPSVLIDLYRNKVQARQVEGPVMEMYEIRRKNIVALLERHGATVIDIADDMHWSKYWISLRYCVTKKT